MEMENKKKEKASGIRTSGTEASNNETWGVDTKLMIAVDLHTAK